jgi:predicted RNase H-like HicB family nuclease
MNIASPVRLESKARDSVSRRVGSMTLTIEVEPELDGRWIAEVPELPGVIVYGESEEAATRAARVLALHVIADRIEHGELHETEIAFASNAAA